MKISKKITAGALSACLVMGATGLTGCGNSKYMKPGKDEEILVVTVGDSNKVYMDEAKCYIFMTEWNYQYNNEIYKAWFGMDDYWGQALEEGSSKTNRDQAKEETMNLIVDYEVVYADAVATGGFDVPDNEMEVIKKNAQNVINCMSDDLKKKTGFTEEDFIKVQEKWNIAARYKEHIIDGFDVTKEDVEKSYDFEEDLRGYETEYIRIPATMKDTDGNDVAYSDEQKAKIKEKMEKIKADLAKEKDLEKVAKNYKEDGAEYNTVTYAKGNTLYFDEDDEKTTKAPDTNAGKGYMAETITLNGGQVSGVFEADGYFYIAKMIDNKSYEIYDGVIEDAITESENKQYDEWLSKLKEGDYKYTINEEVWNDITFGELTIIPDEIKKAFGTLENPAEKK